MLFPKKYQSIIIALIFIIISIIILSFNLRQPQGTSLLRKLVMEAATPLESIVNSSIECVGNTWKKYIFLVGLEEENRKLRESVATLEKEMNYYQEMYLEGMRARKLLALKENIGYPSVAGRVIGINRSSVFKTILIDIGKTDGVRLESPVLIDEGVIGRVIETSWNVSRVLLLTDYNSNIDALIQETRAQGVLQGQGSEGCILNYVHRSEDVQVGDKIISSGMAGVFPKGILLGTVTKVEKKKFGLFQEIEAIQAVDFSKLEEVLVVLPHKSDKK